MLPASCINSSTINTFKKHLLSKLESEDVKLSVLTSASIICGMLVSVNSVKILNSDFALAVYHLETSTSQITHTQFCTIYFCLLYVVFALTQTHFSSLSLTLILMFLLAPCVGLIGCR